MKEGDRHVSRIFFGLGAILNPIYAAVAMALSSITVTLKSMLLNRWKPSA